MAWDTERTKQLLIDAATAEFSTHGLAGARVDRIAAEAGVNKERIYQYFGKKDDLFGIVLERQLAAVMDAVPITGAGIDAVVDYADRVFEYQSRHPALARLVFWEGLERTEPVALEARTVGVAGKVARLQLALPTLSDADARELLATILTLCDGWQVLRTMDRVYTGTIERDAARNASRKAAVLQTIESVTRTLIQP